MLNLMVAKTGRERLMRKPIQSDTRQAGTVAWRVWNVPPLAPPSTLAVIRVVALSSPYVRFPSRDLPPVVGETRTPDAISPWKRSRLVEKMMRPPMSQVISHGVAGHTGGVGMGRVAAAKVNSPRRSPLRRPPL